MKRLRFFGAISILFFSLIGGFGAPEKVYAETLPAKGNDSYFQGIITSHNEETLTAIDTKLKSFEGKTEYEAQKKITEDYKIVINKNYQAYLSAFASAKTAGKESVDAQISGIQAWVRSKDEPSNSVLIKKYNSSSYSSAYNQYATKVQEALKAAIQIQRGDITAGSPEDTIQTGSGTIANAAAGNTNKAKQTNTRDTSKCSLTSFSLSDCLDAGVAWIITHTLLAIVGWVLWLTATMMNYAISIGILEFSKWAPDTLYPIWIIIRQIVSLFIVFAGLYLGFWYILGKGKEFEKYLPWVVIFALFVNFSYPLARTVVDISNIVSLNIYASAVGSDALSAGASVTGDKTAGAIIRDRLGLSGLVDFATGNTKDAEGALNKIDNTPGALMAVIFIGYAAWIFFLVSALIITRTAVLVFLIIASPILFVDSVIPKLGEQAAKLRKIFFEQIFVAPIFMIMLALTLKFLEVFQTNGPLSGTSVASSATGGQTTIVTFFNLLMMLIMLHIMLKVTKSTSGAIGAAVSGAMGTVGGFALGAATGGVGMLGRAGVGRLAAKARDSGWMTSKQGGFVGRHMYNMTDSLAKSSYDGRNSSIVQKGAGKLGISLGMGGKAGFEEIAATREKNLQAHLSRVGTHKQNVYDASGKITARKGDLDMSENATAARTRYINNAGGAVFASSQEKADLRHALGRYADKETRSKEDEILSEYKKIDNSTAMGVAAREKYLNDQTGEAKAKIENYKAKEAREKSEKDETKAFQKDTLKTNQEMVAELKAQRLGGGSATPKAGVESLRSNASHAAERDNVAPVKERSAEEVAKLTRGYAPTEGVSILLPETVKKPLNVNNVDLSKLQGKVTEKEKTMDEDFFA